MKKDRMVKNKAPINVRKVLRMAEMPPRAAIPVWRMTNRKWINSPRSPPSSRSTTWTSGTEIRYVSIDPLRPSYFNYCELRIRWFINSGNCNYELRMNQNWNFPCFNWIFFWFAWQILQISKATSHRQTKSTRIWQRQQTRPSPTKRAYPLVVPILNRPRSLSVSRR